MRCLSLRPALLLCAVAAAPAWAAETIHRLAPVADASIYHDLLGADPSWDAVADGQGEGLWTSTTAGGIVRRALLRFDLGAIPADQQIVSASLTLFEVRARDEHAVGMHRLLASWSEGPANGGSAGVGAAASPGDVTWRWRSLAQSAWDTPGGDFAAQASATQVVGAANSFYTWASTPALLADVRGWHADATSNFGWILRGAEIDAQNAKRFASLQSADVSQRPLLLLVTTPVPEPGQAALLAAGLALLGALARRHGGPRA